MIATIISEKTKHYPVLLNEIISIITPQYGGTFIDCTFGQGGYTKKILEFSNTKVIGIDRDIDSKNISKNIEKEYKNRFLFENKKNIPLDNFINKALYDLNYGFYMKKNHQRNTFD